MQRLVIILTTLICAFMAFSATDDYNSRQAKRYTQEVEYYQKKADGYRREAQYYLKKAEGYQREAAYYTRKGDTDRTKDYNRRAERTMDDYKTKMRYTVNADDKAANYLKQAVRLLKN